MQFMIIQVLLFPNNRLMAYCQVGMLQKKHVSFA